jgi:hypothetical protein
MITMFMEMPRAPAVAAETPTKLGNRCRVMVEAAGRIVTNSGGANATGSMADEADTDVASGSGSDIWFSAVMDGPSKDQFLERSAFLSGQFACSVRLG